MCFHMFICSFFLGPPAALPPLAHLFRLCGCSPGKYRNFVSGYTEREKKNFRPKIEILKRGASG